MLQQHDSFFNKHPSITGSGRCSLKFICVCCCVSMRWLVIEFPQAWWKAFSHTTHRVSCVRSWHNGGPLWRSLFAHSGVSSPLEKKISWFSRLFQGVILCIKKDRRRLWRFDTWLGLYKENSTEKICFREESYWKAVDHIIWRGIPNRRDKAHQKEKKSHSIEWIAMFLLPCSKSAQRKDLKKTQKTI
jgi:hypothetical protein